MATKTKKSCKFGTHFTVRGGGLPASTLKDILSNSYNAVPSDVGDYRVDRSLSGQRAQVYHNPKNNHVIVAHRGTQGMHDWFTDMNYGMWGHGRNTTRFQHAKRIQEEAEKKYGTQNLTTVGHSLGAAIAEDVGQGKHVITLNKPSLLLTTPKHNARQYDIRTSHDPVSALRPLHAKNNLLTIPSRSQSLLTEHGTATLGRLGDQEVGEP